MNSIYNIPLAYYAATGAINFATSFAIGFFIYKHKSRDKSSKIFSIFCFSVAQFSLFYFLWLTAPSNSLRDVFLRTCMIGVIFMPSIFTHFVISFLNRGHGLSMRAVSINYFISFIIAATVYTPLYATPGGAFLQFPYWAKPSILFPAHLMHFFVNIIYSHYKMWNRIQRSSGLFRTQIQYVFWGTTIGYLGGVTNYLCWYGIKVPPVLNILVSLYVASVGYAIVRHQLMDIEVIIRKTAVFAGLFAFVYGTFVFFTILTQNLFSSLFGASLWTAALPTVFIIAISMRPVERFLTDATERYLFQKKYDYRHLLKTFTNEVLTVLDLRQLPEQTVAGLIRILKLESATILLHAKELKKYKIASSIGIKETQLEFFEGDLIIGYLKAAGTAIVKDKVAERMGDDSVLKENFQQLNAQICLPIAMHDDLIGILALGMKKSGEDFTQEDIDILGALARTLAIAISNAQLFDELSKTQAEAAQREKMAVIGTLAAGINHEICNPLGIVRGQCEMFLLNHRDGFYQGKTGEEVLKISTDIMGKVIKETDRATAITKKLSSFAKPSKRSDFEEVQVDKEVDEVMGLLGHDLELSNIELQKDFPPDFPAIFADRKQIQEVLFNIIRNAAQAMDKKQGHITVSGFSSQSSATVRIADNGSGIPADKIEQIFHPFYTTKAPGKGTGLGLFIVKQVVERNKGTIAVESQAGVGTTFTLKFPAGVHATAKVEHA